MTRKQKIESLKNLIGDLETSLKRQPTTIDQFRDLDRKEKILKETKRELRSLMYTKVLAVPKSIPISFVIFPNPNKDPFCFFCFFSLAISGILAQKETEE